MSIEESFRQALAEVRKQGIFLEFDNLLPSVATLVAGGPIRGSWWAHPRGHGIHEVAGRLTFHREVTVAKLVSKKVTFVHRRLWPSLVAVGSARQSWQLRELSSAAKSLLHLVDTGDRVQTDRISRKANWRSKRVGDAARELETRLLVHSVEIHTESGAHAKQLETWKVWAREARVSGRKMHYELARKRFETVLSALNQRYKAKGKLPWD